LNFLATTGNYQCAYHDNLQIVFLHHLVELCQIDRVSLAPISVRSAHPADRFRVLQRAGLC
jgi:hypothetical protein